MTPRQLDSLLCPPEPLERPQRWVIVLVALWALLLCALLLWGCTPLAYQQHPDVWLPKPIKPDCHCTTDTDCVQRCGGDGNPDPATPPDERSL